MMFTISVLFYFFFASHKLHSTLANLPQDGKMKECAKDLVFMPSEALSDIGQKASSTFKFAVTVIVSASFSVILLLSRISCG